MHTAIITPKSYRDYMYPCGCNTRLVVTAKSHKFKRLCPKAAKLQKAVDRFPATGEEAEFVKAVQEWTNHFKYREEG